ncbi:DUF4158 domain-containing protein [Saccharothrix sp. Mg75]|uniref:DUF4158 domain-containing protein n=1 Tax=Saccharothrix sp. Mg75 TaxID=3445357 RepID=UPI003EEAABCD
MAEKAIRKAVTTKDNPADLINVALEELVRARRELPGFTTLDKMVSAIRTETNTRLFALVATRLDAADRRRLARLLWLDPTSRRSEFDRLKTPAKAATLGKFKLRLAHLQALDELGATEQWLDGIPATKIAHFAGEARVMRWPSGPGGCCSRRWRLRAGWRGCRRRMRWWRRTTATTTCRCWRSSTRATARRCSPCSTPSTWSRPAPITACWTLSSSCTRSGAAPASTFRRRSPSGAGKTR